MKYKLNKQNVPKLNVLFGFESFSQYNDWMSKRENIQKHGKYQSVNT